MAASSASPRLPPRPRGSEGRGAPHASSPAAHAFTGVVGGAYGDAGYASRAPAFSVVEKLVRASLITHSLIEQGSFEQELHFRPLSDPLLVGCQRSAHTSLEQDLARLPSILKLQIAAAPHFLLIVAVAGSRQLAQQLDSTNQAQHC